ncbi:MAG: branched-chain amino acid ABC transporter permease [Bacteroidota bacterium]
MLALFCGSVLAGFPWLVNAYWLYIGSLIFIQILIAMGMSVLMGYSGQISLGHAAFVAIGAYGTLLLRAEAGWPFLSALLVASLFGGLIGALVGRLGVRLKGPYLAVLTMAFGMACLTLLGRSDGLGQHAGLIAPPLKSIAFLPYSPTSFYLFLLFLVGLVYVWLSTILGGKIGRALKCIRDQEHLAESVGISPTYYKVLAFALSAFLAALAGGCWMQLLGLAHPDNFTFQHSVQFLAVVVLGGMGHIKGAVLGAALFTFIQVQLESQLFDGPSAYFGWIFSGGILILILSLEPGGLWGLWQKWNRPKPASRAL